MHAGGVIPGKERLIGFNLTFHKIIVGRQRLFIDRFHALGVKRAGVFNLAIGSRFDDATRAELFAEFRVFRIVRVLRFFFRIQVVEITHKLVEAMGRRQKLIPIAEVVFTKLAGGITELFENRRDGGVFFLQTLRRARHADFAHPGTKRHLAGDKGRTACGGALLRVVGGKLSPFRRDAVNIRGFIPHHSLVIGTEIPVTNIIAKDHHDIGFALTLFRGGGRGIAGRCRLCAE